MENFLMSIFMISMMIFFKNFKKKLNMLLSLEFLMIQIIAMIFMSNFMSGQIMTIIIIMTIMMVLDSTFGITCLLSSSRMTMKNKKGLTNM